MIKEKLMVVEGALCSWLCRLALYSLGYFRYLFLFMVVFSAIAAILQAIVPTETSSPPLFFVQASLVFLVLYAAGSTVHRYARFAKVMAELYNNFPQMKRDSFIPSKYNYILDFVLSEGKNFPSP